MSIKRPNTYIRIITYVIILPKYRAATSNSLYPRKTYLRTIRRLLTLYLDYLFTACTSYSRNVLSTNLLFYQNIEMLGVSLSKYKYCIIIQVLEYFLIKIQILY